MTLMGLFAGFGRWRALGVMLAGFATLSVACGDGPDRSANGQRPPFDVAITTSDLAVGKERFAFVLLKDDKPIDNETVYLRFFKVNPDGRSTLAGEGPIPWSPLSAKPTTEHKGSGHLDTEVTGVYYANIEFDQAGTWGLGVTRGEKLDPPNEVRVAFTVAAATKAPAVGARAVSAKSPTLKEAPLRQIDTSPIPDPAFHEVSIADAIMSGKPTVVVFATPSFCVSRTCGPTMEVVREAWESIGAKAHFVHVEPYKLTADGQLATDASGQRMTAEAGDAWRLPTEPWVFVVDDRGIVVARFDGPFAIEELLFALAQTGVA